MKDMDQPVEHGTSGEITTGIELRGFACQCGEVNKKKMTDLREWALTSLGMTKPEFLLSRIVSELLIRFGAAISDIPCDPGGWAAIKTSVVYPDYVITPNVTSWVECDRIEDGIVLTYKLYTEQFPEGNMNWNDDDD